MRAHSLIARFGLSIAAVASVAAVTVPAASAATTPPVSPTITAAFSPSNQIGVGSTTALGFTITNPNATTKLTGVGVSVGLPAGVVVDLPNGETGTCGSTTPVYSPSGGNQIILAGGALAGGASCTISVDVTSNTPGNYVIGTTGVTASQTSVKPYDISGTTGATAALQVFAAPTVSIQAPANGGKFSVGQKVKATYTCTDATGAPGIATCAGDVPSGQDIDTSTPGKQTFSVLASSIDGANTTKTVSYTVVASNKLTGTSAKATKKKVTVQATAPGAGKLSATLKAKGKTLASSSKTLKDKGQVSLSLKLKSKATLPKGAKVTLTFTPKGGKTSTTTLKA